MAGDFDPKKRVLGMVFFARYCVSRFASDKCPRAAAALSYSSLLAIVPLMAIGLGLLSAFPAFESLRDDLQAAVFANLLPDAGIEIDVHVAAFVDNARGMTGIGVLALAATAILLLSTITSAFNAIWRVADPRSLVARLMVYWAVLTLGPLMLGASLSLSSYGFAVVQWSGMDGYSSTFGLTRALPFLLAAAGFTVLYTVVPARVVGIRHAAAGAVVAALLFELLKRAFGLYLLSFPSYQAVYGALAAVPIFLVWMYLSWAVVLFGAEIAAALPEWRAVRPSAAQSHGPGARLGLALAILTRLRVAAQTGEVLKEKHLARGLPASLDDLGIVLRRLRMNGFITRTGSRWVLSRDLLAASLDELIEALDLSLEPGEAWSQPVRAILSELSASSADLRGRSLAEILDQASASVPVTLPGVDRKTQ